MNSLSATGIRIPETITETYEKLQKENRYCELSDLMEEHIKVILRSNDERFVWLEWAKFNLHCGDTAQAMTHIEEAFLCGLSPEPSECDSFLQLYVNPAFDKLCATYSKISTQNQIDGLWAMYFGMLLIMMLYNLILFLSLGESSFLLLVLFIFLTLHAFGLYHPELGRFVEKIFPWIHHLDFIQRPMVFCVNLSLTVYILFIRRFFNLHNDRSWIRINNVLLTISVVFCLMAFLGIRSEYLRSPLDALIVVLGGLFSGIVLLIKRIPYAKLFFAANMILTLGYIHAILNVYFNWNQLLISGVFGPEKFSLILFLLILSLSVSSKINNLKSEKLAIEQESVRTLETRVIERTQELQIEKLKVEEKNTEILSSIEYARRIQNAILPPMKIVKGWLKESFILYMPKDIVAGDFYWLEKVGNDVYVAACDCTGHGVPGALVSVVCNNALNRALNEFSERDPGKILDKTRELVVENFAKSDDDVKDGMDISLACINLTNGNLLWAGANNPLWIYRSNNNTIEEIRADKQPVGKGHEHKPFQTHKIQLNKGDLLYLFTDGYADQFGGDKGKKLTRTKFKDLLVSVAGESIERQHALIAEMHLAYRGSEEQVDDICIIGIRFH